MNETLTNDLYRDHEQLLQRSERLYARGCRVGADYVSCFNCGLPFPFDWATLDDRCAVCRAGSSAPTSCRMTGSRDAGAYYPLDEAGPGQSR